jgi:hypothetical protein
VLSLEWNAADPPVTGADAGMVARRAITTASARVIVINMLVLLFVPSIPIVVSG